MKKQRGLPGLAGLCGALALCGAHAALAQTPTPVTPSDIDRTQFRASARAMGMGGTDLIQSGDASAAAYNPASIAAAGQYSESQSVVGRTSNIHVSKINDLSKGLKDIGNNINNNNGSLSNIRDSFQKVYNFATDAGANDSAVNGSPATLSASLAPAAGVSIANKTFAVGVVGFGTLAAKVQIQPVHIPVAGLSGPTGELFARYGVLGLTNIAVPFSVPLPVNVGTLGISPRYTQASFAAAGFLADETSLANGVDASTGAPNGNISGATYKEVHQSKFDVDLGFTSIPDPIYHIRGAIVVHNLLSPSYHLARVVNGTSLGVIPGGDFNFTMKPQIDLGGLGAYNGITYAAELHDVNNVNGGKIHSMWAWNTPSPAPSPSGPATTRAASSPASASAPPPSAWTWQLVPTRRSKSPSASPLADASPSQQKDPCLLFRGRAFFVAVATAPVTACGSGNCPGSQIECRSSGRSCCP